MKKRTYVTWMRNGIEGMIHMPMKFREERILRTTPYPQIDSQDQSSHLFNINSLLLPQWFSNSSRLAYTRSYT